MPGLLQRLLTLGAAAFLASCTLVPKPGPDIAQPAAATTAALLGTSRIGSVGGLGIDRSDAESAFASFRESCSYAERREDRSGLTTPEDWQGVCAAARSYSGDPRRFFADNFEPVRIGSGEAFATGYFEPEIAGSRTRRPGYEQPVYAMPADLVRCWRDDIPEAERTGNPPLSRKLPDGRCTEYYTRAEIDDGALAGRGLEIGWAADPVEIFFLQIQGSGRLMTPEGEVIRIGYAGQNGHSYTGIGGVMRERGLLGTGPGQYAGSMQGIMQYIRENPAEGRALMRLNESWVFFRELTGDGPLGSLGVPVRGRSSVAVDPAFVPYGAPVWLDLDRAEADGLWIAQDTGGAIKGANRFDTFWGAGSEARTIAGGMSGRGQALVLLPKSAARRLTDR
jgi:membrane-bound lytic murein transglycosylase A